MEDDDKPPIFMAHHYEDVKVITLSWQKVALIATILVLSIFTLGVVAGKYL